MSSMKCFQAAVMLLSVIGFSFAGTEAQAGHKGHSSCSSGSYSRVHTSFGGDHYRVSFSVGNASRHCSTRHVTYHRRDYGHCNSRGYRGHGTYGHSNRGYHYDRRSYHRQPVVVHKEVHHVQHRPSGYWKRVYHPPVYETRYYPCGTSYRVCVRAGYYDKVWVSTRSRHCY